MNAKKKEDKKTPEGILENIITYFCFKANPLSLRKLTKLVYLADVYYYQDCGQRLTEVPFKHYRYGAWSPEIGETLEELYEKGIIEEHVVETREGNLASVPRPAIDRTTVDLSEDALRAIEMVLGDFGSAPPDVVVDYTKKTLPFLNTPFDEEIDFSRSDPAVAYAKEKGIPIEDAIMDDILSNEDCLNMILKADKSLRSGGRIYTHKQVFGSR